MLMNNVWVDTATARHLPTQFTENITSYHSALKKLARISDAFGICPTRTTRGWGGLSFHFIGT